MLFLSAHMFSSDSLFNIFFAQLGTEISSPIKNNSSIVIELLFFIYEAILVKVLLMSYTKHE